MFPSTRSAMLLLVCLGLLSTVSGQMWPQCQCSYFHPYYAAVADTITYCADRCQNHFTSLGASYPAARQCIMSKMPVLKTTLGCMHTRFGETCANTPGAQVPKRYAETIQLAAFREITGQLNRAGIESEALSLVQVARKAVGCIMKCVQASGQAGKTCGLALPSDNQIVATVKSCAMDSGFLTTPSFREMCGCLARAGINQLAHICPRIVIS